MGRSYERSVFWGRLSLAAFFTVTACTIVWAVPWFPYGTDVDDYNTRVGMMVLLALSAAFFAFFAVRLRDRMRRTESTYVTLSSVHDRLTDMRRREYFYDRLLLECDRSRQAAGTFAVVVLRTSSDDAAAGGSSVHRMVEALEPMAKEYDWLAPIGAQEVALFAPRISEREAPGFAEDLRGRVESALADTPGVRLLSGWAAYGPGMSDAGDILGQARRMVSKADLPERAAA